MKICAITHYATLAPILSIRFTGDAYVLFFDNLLTYSFHHFFLYRVNDVVI